MLIETRDLKVGYKTDHSVVQAVRGVDLKIKAGECVGLVGESGCGKTTVGLSMTKLIPERKAIITGRIFLKGQDILELDAEALRKIRGKKISYVFQEPSSSLNPVFTICEQLKESLPEADNPEGLVSEILRSVGLESLIDRKKTYPHELSGGMQQRVMIGMAIASRPEFLILDEPLTALDVTVQRQILGLIMELKNKMGIGMLFISHDLRVIFKFADRINTMYAGRIIEEAPKEKIVSCPGHPYTMGLIGSIPSHEHRKKVFEGIQGNAPSFLNLPDGCKFNPRCKFRIDRCIEREPELEEIAPGHFSRCIRAKELVSCGAYKSNEP